jgi:hypothetical protein
VARGDGEGQVFQPAHSGAHRGVGRRRRAQKSRVVLFFLCEFDTLFDQKKNIMSSWPVDAPPPPLDLLWTARLPDGGGGEGAAAVVHVEGREAFDTYHM